MTERIVLVATPFLVQQRAAWAEGLTLVEPRDLTLELASRIDAVVVADSLDPRLVDSLPRLALVACFTTGYPGIDRAQLRARGIVLTSGGGVNAHDVADHAIALLLAWWHGIPRADAAVRAGAWREGLVPRPSLRGKRAGIVGLGRIGLAIAHRAAAHGMTVSWWGPREKPDAGFPRSASLLALASDADVLFVASRALAANAGQIGREALAALGSKGVLVNVSRGALVDEAALVEALEQRTIAGAALDVFSAEPTDAGAWRRFDNVVLTPHMAGFTTDGGTALFAQLRENLRRHFAGEPLLTPVEDAFD